MPRSLGVSPDSADSHVRFKDKYSLPFVLLSDPEHEVAQAYDVWREKTMYGRTHGWGSSAPRS